MLIRVKISLEPLGDGCAGTWLGRVPVAPMGNYMTQEPMLYAHRVIVVAEMVDKTSPRDAVFCTPHSRQ